MEHAQGTLADRREVSGVVPVSTRHPAWTNRPSWDVIETNTTCNVYYHRVVGVFGVNVYDRKLA
jgi:hypothetical protein